MTLNIISAIASACTLGVCLYALCRLLAPIFRIEQGEDDDNLDK